MSIRFYTLTILTCFSLTLAAQSSTENAREFVYDLNGNVFGFFQENPTISSGREEFGMNLNMDLLYYNQSFVSVFETRLIGNIGIKTKYIESEERIGEEAAFSFLDEDVDRVLESIQNQIHLNLRWVRRPKVYMDKFFVGVDFGARTQILTTYSDTSAYNANYLIGGKLKKATLSESNKFDLIQNFLSPLTTNTSLGFEIRSLDNLFSFFCAPISLKTITFANEDIPSLSVAINSDQERVPLHGNDDFAKFDLDLGFLMRLRYEGKLLKDKYDNDVITIDTNTEFFWPYLIADENYRGFQHSIYHETNLNFTILRNFRISANINLIKDTNLILRVTNENGEPMLDNRQLSASLKFTIGLYGRKSVVL